MKILTLETSAKAASVAIMQEQKLLGEFYVNNGLTHSVTAAPMIKNLLNNLNLAIEDIDIFGVSNGPGSFTGTRIGISVIKGLAFALNKPCFSVSSLYAMAQNLIDENCIAICAMDARRNQVYNANFEIEENIIKRLTPDRALPVEDLIEEIKNINKKIIFVGDGAHLCYNQKDNLKYISYMASSCNLYQKASGVAKAFYSCQEKEIKTVLAQDLVPFYLRQTGEESAYKEFIK